MCKIMLVEDDKRSRDELEGILNLSGYKVTLVDNYKMLYQAALENSPDVILLNLNLGNAQGFRLAYELKQYPETIHIPIVGLLDYYLYCIQNLKILDFFGIERCVKKPCRPLDVISHIEMARG